MDLPGSDDGLYLQTCGGCTRRFYWWDDDPPRCPKCGAVWDDEQQDWLRDGQPRVD